MSPSLAVRPLRPEARLPQASLRAEGVLTAVKRGSDDPAMAVVTIAALCQATGATARALRHYEDIGLLKPVRSRGNGRLFTPHQCTLAALIVALRRFDVALSELPPLIDFDRPEVDRLRDVHEVLERKAAELTLRLNELHGILAEGQPCHRPAEARRFAG